MQVSALEDRIKQGKADPITTAEKVLVAQLREGYEKKYGASKPAKNDGKASSPA
ncbi:hypothetical protein OIU93_18350 [Paeniglutamicibacter sp. ZC-3]|uniref:hypothetical protein n=1 Tax=Paeniglutamicibacter sp. ZC-3 TaxID=2986919 RepID=UPI0021F79F14|nr:hypothetical protein [Paeniglutamicibacter sp. ZC-3]MCV9996237.1 hypothetical protein [Paeniglutamicibacter sp. ZC-3]